MSEYESVAWNFVREPRTRVALAGIAGAAPLVLGSLIWVATLSFWLQLVVGLGMGVATVASFHFWAIHRKEKRQRLAVKVTQMAQLDLSGLKRLLPGHYFPNWVLLPKDFEKVGWMNKQIEKAWPVLDKAASDMLTLQLQQVLDQYRIGPIQRIFVKSVTLGKISPMIGGVKVTEGGKDESTVEIMTDWRHGQDQKMLLELQTTGPDLSVEIKDFKIYGVLKVVCKPLVAQFPGFGAVTASLQEPPLLDFCIKVLGGDVLQIPGLEKMIDNIVKTALMDMLVWPSRMVFPILPGDYSFLEMRSVGQLEVLLVQADKLLNKETFGKSDPFVQLFIRQKADWIKKSSIKKNSLSPVWNEKFILEVEDPESQNLTVRVMDSDTFRAADFLGFTAIPIKEFQPNIPKDMWVTLVADKKKPDLDKPRGRVHLVATYKPFSSEQMGLNQFKKTASVTDEEPSGATPAGAKEGAEGGAIGDVTHNQDGTGIAASLAESSQDTIHDQDVNNVHPDSANGEKRDSLPVQGMVQVTASDVVESPANPGAET
ncbi:hypothetical protein O6H91_09G027300 [Diphasiastrum complanatum]|uniref:Uncharacterized protein n=1 Tax=Diphasiastrum complanatum TaxID=34168 RepID=A0ACC2CMI4_DIPCM|nr:hypothetical protein O6H91_09G027300 [Diphasiastrum complanatum]